MISWMVHYLILDQIKVPYLNCSNEPPDNPEHFISGSKRHLLEKVVPHKRILGLFSFHYVITNTATSRW